MIPRRQNCTSDSLTSEQVGGFGGTDAGALKGSVEPRGHGAAKGVVLVTAFEVSDGLGMSPHVLISLDLYLIQFKTLTLCGAS